MVNRYYSLDNRSERMEMLEDYLEEIKSLPTEILKDIVEPYNCYNIDVQKTIIQNLKWHWMNYVIEKLTMPFKKEGIVIMGEQKYTQRIGLKREMHL